MRFYFLQAVAVHPNAPVPQTFNTVHSNIAWHREHAAPGEVAEQLDALLASMTALLERYPAAPSKPAEDPSVTPQPLPSV